METYSYDSASAGMPEQGGDLTSAPAADTASAGIGDVTPAEPGFGPVGPVTPALPDDSGSDVPAAPGFGPSGNVTPGLSSPNYGSSSSGGCINCSGSGWNSAPNGTLWTWGILSPFFSTSSEIAHLRFYNAASIREPVDIYLNGRLVVSDLDYMNYTRYMHIIPGIYQLTVYRRTNPGFAIINTNIRLRSGYSYTLAILGTFNDFSVQMINA